MTWSNNLQSAQSFAQKGDFNQFLALCQQIVDSCPSDAEAVLSVGVLLLNFGFLTGAKSCFLRVCSLLPSDPRPIVNFANLARDAGEHSESRRLYSILLQHFPDNPIIRRNLLTSLEYDPSVSDKERLDYAKAWGKWAIAKAGGLKTRPQLRPLNNRQLRVGYVSADFCQHTVGLFVKDILASHNPEKITAFAYNAGSVKDWVTDAICKVCQFR
ncbi:MAG: methyltransferase type 11, partial [Desulfamplus sp.]|nr:methyltransferase type 11 [Desulfamplus sp.]